MARLTGEYVFERIVRHGIFREQGRGDIKDHALIGNSLFKFGLMYAPAADEHDVAGQQKIAPPLYGIAAAAREKKHDLAEFVIVVINLRATVVFQVKESEILQQVSALLIVFVHDALHKSIFCKEYSIECVYFARRAQ